MEQKDCEHPVVEVQRPWEELMTLLQSFGVSVDQFTWQSFADWKFLWEMADPVAECCRVDGKCHGTYAYYIYYRYTTA